MQDICRLCLCISSPLKQELFKYFDFLTKISLFLRVEFSDNKSLPSQVCSACIDKIDQILIFQEKVIKNQQILEAQLALGENNLEIFYSSLKVNVKVENEIDKEETQSTPEVLYEGNISETNDEIKTEISDIVYDNDYSSDENYTPPTVKKVKKRKKSMVGGKKRKKKVLKTKVQQNVDTANDTSLNILETDKENKTSKPDLENSEDPKYETQPQPSVKVKKVKVAPLIFEAREKNDTAKNNNIENKCLCCLKMFLSLNALKKHYKTHLPPVRVKLEDYVVSDGNGVKCLKCGQFFKQKKHAYPHMKTQHIIEGRPLLCRLCGKTFKVIASIILHSRVHSGPILACSFKCGYTAKYKQSIKAHELRIHEKKFKYNCDKCGQGFLVKNSLEDHKNVHTGEKPHVCDLCGKAFYYRHYLKKHCAENHPDASGQVKKLACLQCFATFETKFCLQQHMTKEHGQEKTQCLCLVCGKTFARRSNLHAHEKSHVGIRPHTCSICKKAFKSTDKLKRHIKTHDGVRDHVCLTCGKAYAQSYALNVHIRRHHSKDTLKCDKCEQMLPSQALLLKHRTKCSPIKS